MKAVLFSLDQIFYVVIENSPRRKITRFSQTQKNDNNANIANFVFPIYLQFSSLFITYEVSKYDNRCQWM